MFTEKVAPLGIPKEETRTGDIVVRVILTSYIGYMVGSVYNKGNRIRSIGFISRDTEALSRRNPTCPNPCVLSSERIAKGNVAVVTNSVKVIRCFNRITTTHCYTGNKTTIATTVGVEVVHDTTPTFQSQL
jgi:hypothetical protein